MQVLRLKYNTEVQDPVVHTEELIIRHFKLTLVSVILFIKTFFFWIIINSFFSL